MSRGVLEAKSGAGEPSNVNRHTFILVPKTRALHKSNTLKTRNITKVKRVIKHHNNMKQLHTNMMGNRGLNTTRLIGEMKTRCVLHKTNGAAMARKPVMSTAERTRRGAHFGGSRDNLFNVIRE